MAKHFVNISITTSVTVNRLINIPFEEKSGLPSTHTSEKKHCNLIYLYFIFHSYKAAASLPPSIKSQKRGNKLLKSHPISLSLLITQYFILELQAIYYSRFEVKFSLPIFKSPSYSFWEVQSIYVLDHLSCEISSFLHQCENQILTPNLGRREYSKWHSPMLKTTNPENIE